jgi:hypothetical protein
LSAEERDTLHHLLVRAAGTESPPCSTQVAPQSTDLSID